MKRGARIIAVSAAVLACGGAAYLSYARFYAGPRAELVEQVNAARRAAQAYERELDRGGLIRAELNELAATMLGSRPDVVVHRFRTGLAEVVAEAGLSREQVVEVHSRTGSRAGNPAGRMVRTPRALRDGLRGQVDFEVVDGEVRAVGALEQVLRATAAVRAQPWVHRVNRIQVRPRDRGETFDLSLSVSTIFARDLVPPDAPAPGRAPLPELMGPAVAVVAEQNIFREPPPRRDPRPVVQEQPQEDPPPPYHDWRLAGLWETAQGVLAVVVDRSAGGASRTLAVGDRVLDAVFVGGEMETAIFELDGKRYEVSNGRTLAERREIDKSQ